MKTKILFCDIDETLTGTISGNAFKQHSEDIKVIEGVQKAIAYRLKGKIYDPAKT